MVTVREATLDLLRRLDLTTMFANPGSTEVPFLTDLPDDIQFVLGLHEAAVVGMATGWALANRRPALVNLHTVAGLGNAVGALATARQNRAPLVVIVGAQDRRHLAYDPFLSGVLNDLAGGYPVWVEQPPRAQDVPGAIARSCHEANGPIPGPALVIVPMDDWDAIAEEREVPAPVVIHRSTAVDDTSVALLADALRAARTPALVVGAGCDDPVTWLALAELAEHLSAPVWQEPFGARAGFPQDHPRFAGHLPASRSRLREALADHDVVFTVGAPVFRQYPYEDGRLAPENVKLILLTEHPDEAHRAPVELAVVAPLSHACRQLVHDLRGSAPGNGQQPPAATDNPAENPAEKNPERPRESADEPTVPAREPATQSEPAATPAGRFTASQVYTALAAHLPADTVLVEETPSTRMDLVHAVPARHPLGFLSAAGGGLGFAMPAAVGIRMAQPATPVVCVVGDGSSLYTIQSLWSAVQYQVGVIFVVMANGGYAILDRLVANYRDGGKAPWPSLSGIKPHLLAAGFGCPAVQVSTAAALDDLLDTVTPDLATRDEPLLVEVAIASTDRYRP